MYGIVNKAIKELVCEQFGQEAWEQTLTVSKVPVEDFLGHQPYPDAYTFQLAGAASKVLNLPLRDVLIAFGEYWILKTGLKSYGALMEAGGDSLRSFLLNLPNFHSRVMLIFPELTPPEFVVQELDAQTVEVAYYSSREGLSDFVYGLLQGLGKMYNESPQIQQITAKTSLSEPDVFTVVWA